MIRMTKKLALRITALAILSFGLLLPFFTVSQMIEVSYGLVLGSSLAVMLTWGPAAYRAAFFGQDDGAAILQMAIFGFGFAAFIHRLYAYAALWLKRPEWLVESYLAAAAPWALGVGLLMVLLAPGTQNGEIPLRNYVWFVFAGVVGALVSGIAIGVSLGQVVTY